MLTGQMKKLLTCLILVLVSIISVAQNKTVFSNVGPSGIPNAPVSDASGNLIGTGRPYVADFFWSTQLDTPMDSLMPYGKDTPFQSLTNGTTHDGYFFGGVVQFVLAGDILAQVRVWDTNFGSTYYEARDNGGEFGYSNIITNFPIPPPASPNYLLGLQSFQLQRLPRLSISPTPTNALLFTWPTNITSYSLQENSDLNMANWTTLTNATAVVGSQIQVTITKPQSTMFYRLISQ